MFLYAHRSPSSAQISKGCPVVRMWDVRAHAHPLPILPGISCEIPLMVPASCATWGAPVRTSETDAAGRPLETCVSEKLL